MLEKNRDKKENFMVDDTSSSIVTYLKSKLDLKLLKKFTS